MKTICTFLIIFFISLSTISYSQYFGESAKRIYKAPGFKEVLKTHKTIAIIPFKTTLSYKNNFREMDEELIQKEEAKIGTAMQQGLFTYLMSSGYKISVEFQDLNRTNYLLKNANLLDKTNDLLPDSLAKILGVDAIIKCNYDREIVLNKERFQRQRDSIPNTKAFTGSGELTMQIYDGKKGNLLWLFYKGMNEDATSSKNEIMDRMMSLVTRNFPY